MNRNDKPAWLLVLLLLGPILGLAACGDAPRFRMESFLQDRLGPIRLNEPLVFRFNEEVDPSSLLSPSTLSLHDESGGAALGSWRAKGQEVIFEPDSPLQSDLSDTGFKPGRTYTVRFQGFPAFGSLISTEGRHLDRSYSISFKTVSEGVSAPERFIDPESESGPHLVSVNGEPIEVITVKGIRVKAGDRLALDFSEPLFPPSVLNDGSTIIIIDDEGAFGPTYLRLQSELASSGFRVLLEPEGRFREGQEYKLYRDHLGFTDFGGKSIDGRCFNYISVICGTGG